MSDPGARELKEALERETATAEILQIIASSPADTQPVFDAIVRSGSKLFPGALVSVALRYGETINAAAVAAPDPDRVEAWRRTISRTPLARDYLHGAALLDRRIVDVPDVADAPAEFAAGAQNFLTSGNRAITIMPMMRGDAAIGALSVVRHAPGPLSDEQLALLKTFAAQAVIAIENTRLVNELRQRTDDLSESLEQQTAISDILRVISNSPGNVTPVFEAVARHAARICEAPFADIIIDDDGMILNAANVGALGPMVPGIAVDRTTFMGRSICDKQTLHVPDLQSPDLDFPLGRQLAIEAGARTALAVPLIRNDRALGTILVRRTEVRPFEDKHIALLKTFADQAAIAIENARLLNELRQRTDDLSESLEQQTATSEVLRVISSSPTNIKPVLDAVVASAARLCQALDAMILLRESDSLIARAHSGPLGATLAGEPQPLNRDWVSGRAVLEARTIHVPDLLETEEFPQGTEMARRFGHRATLAVPLLREGTATGVILVRREEPQAFSDKQIELITNFAAQAVIAIENTRLLTELRRRTDDLTESLEQQTAISEILRVISTSPGNVQPVFDAVAESAARICEAQIAGILMVSDGKLRAAAAFGDLTRPIGEMYPLDRSSAMGRSIYDKQTVHLLDAQNAGDEYSLARELALRFGHRTTLCVPLIHEGRALGTILIRRTEVRAFQDKHIALLKTFADQAAIAIENARLLNELRQRTDDLTESLEQQTATSEVLKIISSSPGDLEPVFEAMLESATRICEAKFGNLALVEGDALRMVALYGAPPAYAEERQRTPLIPLDSVLGRLVATRQRVHVADIAADENAARGPIVTKAGARTLLVVPMLKDDQLIGAIGIYRQEVRPFTDKQIELVTNFAAQAVIAIENTRLLTELRQRTDDLSESLEQQTATSEVLRVISSSPGELAPVFETMLASATRICDARFALLWLAEGDRFRSAALHNVPAAYAANCEREPVVSAGPGTVIGRVRLTKQAVQVEDITAEQAYRDGDPVRLATADLGGARTLLGVPLLKDDEFVGVIAIYRKEPRLFNDKQVELVANFADQAVIAIENTRLLNEVRQQAGQLEAQSQELRTMNQQLEQRVGEQVGEIERMSRLRRFLPPQVADLIVSSGSEKQLESHRREITALFCDLRGFTGFSETSDPEDVMALLREYHKAIGEIIFRHGGTLERFAGDGVMVIFGDPVPLPNPALSAVQMALEMRAAIGRLIDKWSRLGHELGFGIGISHGYATLGTIGFEGRFDYAAIGTVSNVASRLCDEAQPGQILVSPRVLLAVEDAVSVEPVREMSLKGIRRPMLVHNVVGVTTGTPVTG